MNDNLTPRNSYSNIHFETEGAFASRESGKNISVKSERLLKSKVLERTGKIMVLISKRLLQDEKNVNAMEVKETAKRPEQIFGDLICQLLEGIPGGETKDLAKIEVQQAKSREIQNALYTNSFNATPTYGLVSPS